VLLGRLRVRQKLALLVLPLLVLIVIGAVPLVTARVDAAERSARAADVIRRAVRIGELVQELQQERLASLGYLAALERRDRVVARSARVLDLSEQLSADYGGRDDRLDSALRAVSYRSSLEGIRIQVLGQRTSGIGVYTGFTEAITDLVRSLQLADGVDLGTDIGRKQLALDSIIRHDEATAAAGSALFIEPGRRVTPRVIALVSAGQAVKDREERVFVPLADPPTVELYEDVEGGQSSRRVSDYFDRLTQLPAESVNSPIQADLLPKVESLTSLARLVETRAAAQAVDGAAESARRDNWLAGLGIALALLVLFAAGVLSILVARSIARPLRRLTVSADEVADAAQQELVRVADTEDPQAAAPRLRPVQVGTSDELGDLAKAFNRVQQVAADLVERQVVSRRNVATMFGNVGRRTQNLVGRQLAMIDSLERNEQDPVLLDRLYRLDHVSTRLRRNADSLVVLSGAVDPQTTSEPLSVGDTIRSALGEIEGFQRVRLGEVQPVLLTPYVTPDVILLLAELLENGTSFSPPNTEVEVGASRLDSGDVLIRIVDHGLGMTPQQLAAENARLVERERLDMAPTDVLGLFVVGRLARRHGIRVTLQATPGSGVTAEVLVPAGMVVRSAVASTPGPPLSPALASASAPEAVPAGVLAGTPASEKGLRGWWEPAAPSPSAPPASGPPPSGEAPAAEPVVLPQRPAADASGGRGGSGGIRRRVRGAQLPDTGPPPADDSPRDVVQPADEARRSIEDFEEGVRRAQQESAAQREGQPPRNGQTRSVPGTRPVPPLPPLTPPPEAVGPADPARALLAEFEDGVRKALAKLDAVSGAGGSGAFFERAVRRANGNGSHPVLDTPPGAASTPDDAGPRAAPPPSAGPVPSPTAGADPSGAGGPTGPGGPGFRVDPAHPEPPAGPGSVGSDAATGADGAGFRVDPAGAGEPTGPGSAGFRVDPGDPEPPAGSGSAAGADGAQFRVDPAGPAATPTAGPTAGAGDVPGPGGFRVDPAGAAAPPTAGPTAGAGEVPGPAGSGPVPPAAPPTAGSAADAGPAYGSEPIGAGGAGFRVDPAGPAAPPTAGSAADAGPAYGSEPIGAGGAGFRVDPAGPAAPPTAGSAADAGPAYGSEPIGPGEHLAAAGGPSAVEPTGPGGSVGGTGEVAPSAPGAERPGGPVDPGGSAIPTAPGAQRADAPDGLGGATEATEPPPAAERGLTRRVPGAQLPPGARAARPGGRAAEPAASTDAAVREAAAARALVEEFEAGVERALQAGGPTGETSEEGAG
jgi:signal transduction histidine kinase